METVEEAHFNKNTLIYCSTQWEQQLFHFSKQHKTLKKIRGLEEEVITKEDLWGSETISSLQSCIDILDLKIGIMEQSRIKVLKEHPLLLDALEQYEQFLVKLLGRHGHSLKHNRVLCQEAVLKKWDSYVVDHFVETTEVTMDTMNRYMYVIFQCQEVETIMDQMVNKVESIKEILGVSKFRISYIVDPPTASLDCFINNYQNYKKK